MKVSVCIPCYNNPEETERTLLSVANQTMRDYEVCISDDSTDDRIEQLVRRLEEQFPAGAVRYVHNDKPYGFVTNWSVVMQMARGDYIKILFSDDWLSSEDALARYAAMLDENPNADMAFAGSYQVLLDRDEETLRCMGDRDRYADEKDGFPSFTRHADDDFMEKVRKDSSKIFLGNQIGSPSATIFRRKEPLVLFEEPAGYPSDLLLYLKRLRQNPEFAWTKDPLICIGVHANQYSETFSSRDERVYQSFRYIYTTCGLQSDEDCRAYMTREFVIPWHKPLSEARALGIPAGLYLKEWSRMQIETVRCFAGARMARLKGRAKTERQKA